MIAPQALLKFRSLAVPHSERCFCGYVCVQFGVAALSQKGMYPVGSLSLFSIQNAKPKERPYKLSDGHGLHLLIKSGGQKLWRFRYQFGRKEKMLSLGSFPEVSLASARQKRQDARRLVAEGIDPSQQRKEAKIASKTANENTFGVIAEDGKTESTVGKNRWLLQDLASPLTLQPITEITPAEILDILKKIEKSGRRDTARRLRGTLGSVFRFAIATLRAQSSKAAP